MTHPLLLAPVRPPTHPLIDLRCASCEDVDWPEADLVIADPPWSYVQRYGASEPPYPVLTTEDVVRHLARLRAPRMALWITWPIMPEWIRATEDWPWRWVTGGAWSKSDGESGQYGPGHHWAGCSEPVMVYTRGSVAGTNTHAECRNTWATVEHNATPNAIQKRHSVKPVPWMVRWLHRWTLPGALIVDPYAGLGSVAEAVILAGEGRRYLGTEIDPERHASAQALLAQVRA